MRLDARLKGASNPRDRAGERRSQLVATVPYTTEAPHVRFSWMRLREQSEGGVMNTKPNAGGTRRMIRLPVEPEEVPVLRFALDHALSSISEAHPEDRAQLKALIERLEAAQQKGARA